MLQLAIATNTLGRSTPDALQRAADLGFTQVEINLQPEEFDYGYRRKPNARFYRELRQQLDRLGLAVWSVTPPPLTQEQMFFERARKDILMGAAVTAGILGGKVYVVRPADIFTSEMAFAAYWDKKDSPPMIEGYDEAWVQAANRRLATALLNMDHWLGVPLTNQADRIAKITADLAIGWAMDVRRALNRNTLDAWLAAAGDRLAVAYLYDLTEDGRQTLPLSDDWQQYLPPLTRTRLKCLVIQAAQATDDEIGRARTYIHQLITPPSEGSEPSQG